ncbi:hypothetical protein JIG36_32360 [Actinoplanes sp. LDG1-06]|uniref:Uncharacterized protein n=1 Tax=Paractinoplanes ovalisporus TaxID=2810368 RepID=A0ABS2AK28_9ACTN|nr:hypothetical protein [Actinoplanes ovalisporus]MBM2620219.1 hypothetical protein [Actinoplanes ovalisporus]
MKAVVFDLLYTLVHPGRYPGGTGRAGWLSGILGIDAEVVRRRGAEFEPWLESGRADRTELEWIRDLAGELGVTVTGDDLTRIDAGWGLTRREALLDPPPATIATLRAQAHSSVTALPDVNPLVVP